MSILFFLLSPNYVKSHISCTFKRRRTYKLLTKDKVQRKQVILLKAKYKSKKPILLFLDKGIKESKDEMISFGHAPCNSFILFIFFLSMIMHDWDFLLYPYDPLIILLVFLLSVCSPHWAHSSLLHSSFSIQTFDIVVQVTMLCSLHYDYYEPYPLITFLVNHVLRLHHAIF